MIFQLGFVASVAAFGSSHAGSGSHTGSHASPDHAVSVSEVVYRAVPSVDYRLGEDAIKYNKTVAECQVVCQETDDCFAFTSGKEYIASFLNQCSSDLDKIFCGLASMCILYSDPGEDWWFTTDLTIRSKLPGLDISNFWIAEYATMAVKSSSHDYAVKKADTELALLNKVMAEVAENPEILKLNEDLKTVSYDFELAADAKLVAEYGVIINNDRGVTGGIDGAGSVNICTKKCLDNPDCFGFSLQTMFAAAYSGGCVAEEQGLNLCDAPALCGMKMKPVNETDWWFATQAAAYTDYPALTEGNKWIEDWSTVSYESPSQAVANQKAELIVKLAMEQLGMKN